ncbi:MAG: hypothetical protein KDE04_22060, partial [Anaerolineales bacterium]|nr:hypothetical protein [Anaerolineales bacterium]
MKLRHLFFLLPLLLACGPLTEIAPTPAQIIPTDPSATAASSGTTQPVATAIPPEAFTERDCAAGRPDQTNLTSHKIYRAYSSDG